MKCPICNKMPRPVVLRCGHTCCFDCLIKITRTSDRCFYNCQQGRSNSITCGLCRKPKVTIVYPNTTKDTWNPPSRDAVCHCEAQGVAYKRIIKASMMGGLIRGIFYGTIGAATGGLLGAGGSLMYYNGTVAWNWVTQAAACGGATAGVRGFIDGACAAGVHQMTEEINRQL